jgi:hypothetical protein
MFHADRVGLEAIHEDVADFRRAHGRPWPPAPLLERTAREGKGFRDLRAG